jgi:DNA-binding transcriptional MerR regulator
VTGADEDDPALLTAAQAAAEVQVVPATIRKWVQLGHLSPAGRRGRVNLFRLEDVFRAERAAHRRPPQP